MISFIHLFMLMFLSILLHPRSRVALHLLRPRSRVALHLLRPRSRVALHLLRPRSRVALHLLRPRSRVALHLLRPRSRVALCNWCKRKNYYYYSGILLKSRFLVKPRLQLALKRRLQVKLRYSRIKQWTS